MRDYNRNAQARLTEGDRRAVAEWEARAQSGATPKRIILGVLKAEMPAAFHDRQATHLLTDALDEEAFNTDAFEAMMTDLRTTGYDLRRSLQTLAAPVLITQGTSDPISTADELKRTIPKARLEFIANAGHYPWLEQPDEVFRSIDTFLGRLK